MPKKRVFLSAVSSEFAHARQALANHLIALGFDPVWQDAFPDHGNAPSLQRKLYDLVASCDAMICLVGRRSGSYPPPDAATPFAAMLPEDFAEASRTQWEFFFARALGKPWRLFRAHKDWTPDDPAPPIDDRSDRQTAFLAWMDRPDLPWVEFRSSDHLNAEAGKINWDAGPPLRPPREKPIALPYQSLGTLFKGRDQFLRDLRASLLEKTGATAIVSNALLGMGGIGKTRAAVEYAWAYKESYTALLFVQADSPQNLKTNLAALSGPLLLPEQAGRDEDARYHAVLAWLRANPVWLLILDNVDTDAAREAALTILGSLTGGHVVLTSRLDAGAWHEVTPLDLDLLDAGAAVEFLMDATATQRLRRDDDPARAEALATELGRLVLALDLAAATIRQRKCSFADYLVLWHESRDLVKGWNERTLTGYHSAVGQTWAMSEAELSRAARIVLQRLAFLAPDPLPGFALDVPVPHGPAVKAPREALLELAAYSLVKHEPENDQFTVHRLIQDATRRGLAAVETDDRLTDALWWMNAAFEDAWDDPRRWPRLTPLIPHAEAVAFMAARAGNAAPTVRVMSAVGRLLFAQALYDRAEPLFRGALAMADNSERGTHPLLSTVLNDLAGLLRATNRLAEAEPLYRRALIIDEASLGPHHPNVATGLNNLAGLLRATNRLVEAEPLYRRALIIDEASLGPHHPNVATDLNNLAELLRTTNRPEGAEPLLRRALAIDEASLGPEHPNLAIRLNNLGLLLQATNRLAEAEPLMRRALAIDKASLGPGHPTAAVHLTNLAGLLQDTNRLAEAEPLFRRALIIDEASLGPHHPNVATDLNNLAGLLQATNRLAEAEPLMRRHLVIVFAIERNTNHAHPNREAGVRNYANLLAAMGHDEAAIHAKIDAARREAGLG